MRLLVIALLALTLAVVAGHFIAEDPGFIVIGYGGRVLRTTFAFFVLVVAIGLGLLYGGLRLFANLLGLRRRWRRWSEEYRRRRAHRTLTSGLLALAEGEFVRAERLFNRGVDEDAQPEVHYLAAAEAAQALNAPARRDNYLRLAQDLQPDAAMALDLKRAAWQMEIGQIDEAQALVTRLERDHGNNPQVVKLRVSLARRRGDTQALLALLPALRRDRLVSFDAANALERECAVTALRESHAAGGDLAAQWEALSKPMKAIPAVLAAYVQGQIERGQHDEAEAILRKHLDRNWDSELAALYGEVRCEPPAKQLRKVDAWVMTRGDDRGLRLARARLALRSGLWGQARAQLEQLLAAAPAPLLYRLLAEVAEGVGDAPGAANYRRLGLELATVTAAPSLRPGA